MSKKLKSKIIYQPTTSESFDGEKVELCKCGKNPATTEPHSCPYASELYDDDTESCNCCEDCCHECAMDV